MELQEGRVGADESLEGMIVFDHPFQILLVNENTLSFRESLQNHFAAFISADGMLVKLQMTFGYFQTLP